MEKELIKQINTGKLNKTQLLFAKAAICESNLYKIRLNKPNESYYLEENIYKDIKREQMKLLQKDLFEIQKEKIKSKVKNIINNNVELTRFSTPIEVLQYKIKNKPIIIDFEKIEKEYRNTQIIPFVMLNNATYEILLHYLPSDFDPVTYIKLNPELSNLTVDKDIKYHYLKFGRIKNLPYKEL